MAALYGSTDFRVAFQRSEVPKRQADRQSSPTHPDGLPEADSSGGRVLGQHAVSRSLDRTRSPTKELIVRDDFNHAAEQHTMIAMLSAHQA